MPDYFSPQQADCLHHAFNEIHISMRRIYIDAFYFRESAQFQKQWRVLDVGGHKTEDRGCFKLAACDVDSFILNLGADFLPDVQADAAIMPFSASTFDAVICSEMLEHVLDPLPILREIQRVLKPESRLLLCVPFLYRTHAEPYDFARYTDHYWQHTLTTVGFDDIRIKRQGLFWSVLVDMPCEMLHRNIQAGIVPRWQQRLFCPLMARFKRLAYRWDARPGVRNHRIMRGYTTGYGITCRKSDPS